MAEEQLPNLNNLIDGLRARLHEELDVQLRGMAESHTRALEQARQAADAQAEARCAARLEVVRGEWNVRLDAAVANARSEAERAAETHTTRVRMEVEQAAAESVAAGRREIEQAFAAEREQIRAELEAERRRAAEFEISAHRVAELEKELQRIASERDAYVQRVSHLESEGQRQAGELEAERHRASELQADRQRVLDLDAARERTVAEIDALRQRSVAELDALRQRVAELEAEAARTTADLASERDRLKAQLESERQSAEADLQAARDYAAAELNAERERAAGSLADAHAAFDRARAESDAALLASVPLMGVPVAAASVPAHPAAAADTSRVVEAIRTLDDARSLTEVLASAVRAAAAEAQRAAMFLVQGSELREWPVPGVPSVDSSPLRVDGREAGIIADALKHHRPSSTAGADHLSAPFFASLPPGGVAVAVPLIIGGTPVAVLYADHTGEDAAASAWQERIQILGRHAAACAASLTAIRTAQAMHLVGGDTHDHESGDHADQVQAARRYARLLVSEIKLYNESAVRMGRERRDLLVRLEPEIGRARRLFDQRVAASVEGRNALFEQELAQTLADGDPSLLGEPGHQSSSWT